MYTGKLTVAINIGK